MPTIIHVGGGGSSELTGEELIKSKGGGSLTLEKDYLAIVITTTVDGKRTQAGMPGFEVNGLKQLVGVSIADYGYNGSIGKENDFISATYIYEGAKKGHSISWIAANNAWGHIIIIGILSA